MWRRWATSWATTYSRIQSSAKISRQLKFSPALDEQLPQRVLVSRTRKLRNGRPSLRLPRRGEPILRLQRFLVDEARRDLTARAERLSSQLGRPFRSLHVRDTKSRWGSCSSRAGLNFSWRLIFGEDRVREYVVAHEVAHLRHMDHSPAFWAQCEALCPPDLDIDWAKRQLRENGKRWHALVFDGSVA